MEQNRMTGFVECGDTAFPSLEITRLFFSAPIPTFTNAFLMSVCVIYASVFLRCDNSRLIQKILQIRAGKARSRLCDLF